MLLSEIRSLIDAKIAAVGDVEGLLLNFDSGKREAIAGLVDQLDTFEKTRGVLFVCGDALAAFQGAPPKGEG